MIDDLRFLGAMLKPDWVTYELVAAEFERQGKGTPVAAVGFAFDVAAKVRYSASRSRADIITFVADTRSFLPDGKDIDPKMAVWRAW